MKDNDVLAQYKTMRETLVYLCHLDYEDTENQMLERLRMQVRRLVHPVCERAVQARLCTCGSVCADNDAWRSSKPSSPERCRVTCAAAAPLASHSRVMGGQGAGIATVCGMAGGTDSSAYAVYSNHSGAVAAAQRAVAVESLSPGNAQNACPYTLFSVPMRPWDSRNILAGDLRVLHAHAH
eukprot:1136160-Pelagomonas_calceolata.AAC.1